MNRHRAHIRRPGGYAKRAIGAAVVLAAAASLAAGATGAPPSAQRPSWSAGDDASATTKAYVTRFYPRFLTGLLEQIGGANQIIGPNRMGPLWGIVVAPNDDTIYAQFRVDLSKGPQVLTIPATTANYSILSVDVFGDVFHTSIPSNTPGTYALLPPGFQGALPQGVTPITVPYSFTFWTIRADRFTGGKNSESAANTFRTSLQLQPLADYSPASTSGHPQIKPLAAFLLQSKTVADRRIRKQPAQFLTKLQSRMHESTTSPLTSSDTALENAFDADLAAAQQRANAGSPRELNQMTTAAQAAHAAIVKDWKTHTVKGNWVYFDNIGNWGTDYLDRAATAEFLLFGNDVTTSKYFDAFTDARGAPLIGNHAYRLTFPAGAIPQANRFWSLTAYIPPGITLVPNTAQKYLVASYTPGLKKNADGSITLFLQHKPPAEAHRRNWLPVPRGPFSVILRIYGPDGNTSSPTYAPPGISPARSHK